MNLPLAPFRRSPTTATPRADVLPSACLVSFTGQVQALLDNGGPRALGVGAAERFADRAQLTLFELAYVIALAAPMTPLHSGSPTCEGVVPASAQSPRHA
jgi:hypothetical protein